MFFQLADGSNEERQQPVPLETSLPVRAAYEWLNKQDGTAALTSAEAREPET